jgi:hypothetical protein
MNFLSARPSVIPAWLPREKSRDLFACADCTLTRRILALLGFSDLSRNKAGEVKIRDTGLRAE